MARSKSPRPGLVRPALRIIAAGALGVAARGRLGEHDEKARALIAAQRSEVLDRSLPHATDLGSTYALAGAAVTLWALRRKRLARDVAAAGAIAWVVSQAAKPVFKRPRPYHANHTEIMVREPAGLSYPSGHPAVAAAVARVLEPSLRPPARSVVGRIPRLVAFSRIYVGVHYPTDVIGGMWLGRAIGDLWLRYGANADDGVSRGGEGAASAGARRRRRRR